MIGQVTQFEMRQRYGHLFNIYLGYIWITFLHDKIRIGMPPSNKVLHSSYFKDFYFSNYNSITKEKLTMMKNMCNNYDGKLLVKGLVFSMIGIEEEEFLKKAIYERKQNTSVSS